MAALLGEDEEGYVPEAGAHMDTYGRAVVPCLTQMAVTAGNDALWKPLNYQVLIKTRSDSQRTKLLGLEVASQLAERLREEYLVLLPETLPFLSELLEDPEVKVQSRCQQVIKALEALAGESLESYLKN